MNYYYATFSAWTDSLVSASESSTGFAGSPCSHLMASGMFGMGSAPSATMWIDNDNDGADVWRGVVAYMGINEDAQDPSSCGIANTSPNTIKVASWQMAQNYFSQDPIPNTN